MTAAHFTPAVFAQTTNVNMVVSLDVFADFYAFMDQLNVTHYILQSIRHVMQEAWIYFIKIWTKIPMVWGRCCKKETFPTPIKALNESVFCFRTFWLHQQLMIIKQSARCNAGLTEICLLLFPFVTEIWSSQVLMWWLSSTKNWKQIKSWWGNLLKSSHWK